MIFSPYCPASLIQGQWYIEQPCTVYGNNCNNLASNISKMNEMKEKGNRTLLLVVSLIFNKLMYRPHSLRQSFCESF
jgi:hypothetical protein